MSKTLDKPKVKKIAAIAVAAEDRANGQVHISSRGVAMYLKAVPLDIIDRVQKHFPDPPIPTYVDKERSDKPIPNPDDPQYIQDVKDVDTARARANMDAMIVFGVELAEGVPEDGAWLERIKFMEGLGHFKIEIDTDDPAQLEFLYKKMEAVTTFELREIGKLSGVTEEDIAEAEKSF